MTLDLWTFGLVFTTWPLLWLSSFLRSCSSSASAGFSLVPQPIHLVLSLGSILCPLLLIFTPSLTSLTSPLHSYVNSYSYHIPMLIAFRFISQPNLSLNSRLVHPPLLSTLTGVSNRCLKIHMSLTDPTFWSSQALTCYPQSPPHLCSVNSTLPGVQARNVVTCWSLLVLSFPVPHLSANLLAFVQNISGTWPLLITSTAAFLVSYPHHHPLLPGLLQDPSDGSPCVLPKVCSS